MYNRVRRNRLLWLGVLLLGLLQLGFNTTIQSDISAFMPRGQTPQQKLLLEEMGSGPASRLWVLAIDNAPAEELARINRELASQLRRHDGFQAVLNGEGNGLPDGRNRFMQYRYLLDPRVSKDFFSTRALRQAMQLQVRELLSPLSAFSKELVPVDPTGSFLHVVQHLQPLQDPPEQFDGVWFSADHARSFILAPSVASGVDLDRQQLNYDAIQQGFNAVRGSSGAKLVVSGAPFFGLETRNSIRTESKLLTIVASLLITFFILWVYRSLPRAIYIALPLAGGILMAVATVSLVFGEIHGITLAFGITLLGVAIDYPVHLYSHHAVNETLQVSIRRIWPTLRMGVATTVIGYAAMLSMEFRGLAQLAVFSISGLLTAALITRTLLPDFSTNESRHAPRLMQWARRLGEAPRLHFRISSVVLVVAMATAFAYSDRPWSRDIADLSPIPSSLRQQADRLRADLKTAEPRYLALVQAGDMERLLQKQERLRPVINDAIANGVIASADYAAQKLPSVAAQKERQAALPPARVLHQRVRSAQRGLPFRPGTFRPFEQAIADSRSLEPLTPAAIKGTALESSLQGLIHPSPAGVTGLIQFSGVERPQALKAMIEGAVIEQLWFLDIRQSTNGLIQGFTHEVLTRIGLASVLILVALAVGLRDARRVLSVVVPVVLSVVVAATVPLWLGESLNLFHLVSLLLVAGIGLDYALFFTMPRTQGAKAAHTAHSLMICSLSTFAVFATLSLSSIPVLHSIGLAVASGVVAAFWLSWLLAGTKTQDTEV